MSLFSTPDIDADKCVHSMLAVASCSACAEACPRSAIELTPDSLAFDESRCNGCAACVTACPTEAVKLSRGTLLLHQHEGRWSACVGCGNSQPRPGQPTASPAQPAAVDESAPAAGVSCIHALGLADLLALHQRGVRNLAVLESCAGCCVGNEQQITSTLESCNRILCSRGQRPLSIETLEQEQWQRRTAAAEARSPRVSHSRRSLFARFIPALEDDRASNIVQLGDTGLALLSQNEPEVESPGTAQPSLSPALHPFVPAIEAALCSGCDACQRICPSDALTLIKSEGAAQCYSIVAARCTGCALCTDVCELNAVTLEAMQVQEQQEVALESRVCEHCGVEFHYPQLDSTSNRLCAICRNSRHISNLFQVLD